MEEKYFGVLNDRIHEYLCLVIPETERRNTVKGMLTRLVDSLAEDVKYAKSEEEVNTFFSRFVGKILSVIESLGLELKAQKATRKLLLNETYSARDALLGVSVIKEKVWEK